MHPLNDTFKPRVRPITWAVTWITDSQITGLSLPGILDDPGWVSGRPISLRCDITLCRQAGNIELNLTMPIVTLKLLESIEFTANAVDA
jgi:hypothetical protein